MSEIVKCPIDHNNSSEKIRDEIMERTALSCVNILKQVPADEWCLDNIIAWTGDLQFGKFRSLLEKENKDDFLAFPSRRNFLGAIINSTKLSDLIWQAVRDIYYSMCFCKYHNIPSKDMKYLVFENMRYGKPGAKMIYEVLHSSVQDDPNEVKNSIQDLSYRKDERSTDSSPSCHFFKASLDTKWVEKVWSTMEEKVFPNLQEENLEHTNDFKRFITGNTKLSKTL